MADPTHEESHGVESTPSAASIRHYELLETAYQLVKEFNSQGTSSFFHREDSSSAGMFSIHDPAVLNRIKALRGSDQEPAPASIHTLLEVLHEVDPGFRLPTGFHANNIGNAKKFLKYFEHSKDLTLLAGKVNAAYSQLVVLPQAQLSQLREKHPEELAKEAEHDKKHQEGGKEGEAKVLEPYWKTLPAEIHEEEPRKGEVQQEPVEKAIEAPQREEAATVISQQAPSPTRIQRLQTLTSKLPLASARNTLSRALLPIGKFIQRNAGAVIPGLITGAYGAAHGGLALGILYGAGGVAVGAGASALAKRGRSGGPAAQAAITAPIPAPSPEPQEAAPDETPPPRRGLPFRRGAPTESPFSTATKALRIFGPSKTFWIGAGVGLFLILFIMFLGNPGQGGGLNINLPNIPSLNSGGTSQVTIIKSQVNCKEENGYCVVNNGDQIQYAITVTYTGQGVGAVQVKDDLPDQTECLSAPGSDSCNVATKTVTWNLTDLSPNSPQVLSLTIKPLSNDVWLVNSATATNLTVGPTGGGGNSNFEALMTGQGRNTSVLGATEDAFISSLTTNLRGTNLAFLISQQSYLRQVYEAAVASHVNPASVLAIWGVEASFSLNGTEFGCKPFGSGFSAQLSCSVNTLNSWMSYFEQNNSGGSLSITDSCTYADEFLYAYEKYTPVCALNDGNDSARTNYINFYDKLTGQ